MKHLKTIGLAALVIAVFTALAGVGSASAAEFHATAQGVAISGEQSTSLKFTTTGSSVTCSSARFTGTTEATASTTQKVHPEFEGCTSFGFLGSIYNTAGCLFSFHTQTGTVDLEGCTSGAMIITSSSAFGKCVMEIPNQTGINRPILGHGRQLAEPRHHLDHERNQHQGHSHHLDGDLSAGGR